MNPYLYRPNSLPVQSANPDVQQILSDLVAFPVLGGQTNLTILNYIRQYLDGYGVSYGLVPNETGDKASLHCRFGPAVEGGVILSGHTDVVPVEGQSWTTNPFQLTEKDGRLYGRGSADMKGFIACCLAVVPRLMQAPLRRPIYFAFSYDEEVGCLAGPALAAAIREAYPEGPRYAIIGEPSLLQPIVGQKGIVFYETTVNGSAGHSSRIRNEVSAVHEATRLIRWLEEKMNALIAAGHIDARFEPDHTSIHVGIIEGGIAVNVIADHCTFKWDVRNIPRDRIETIYDEFSAYCHEREATLRQRFADFSIVTSELHPIVPALDTPEHLSVVRLVRQLTGQHELRTVAFAAEAGQFAEAGFETVICGPGSIAQAHRANEFIEIDQLRAGQDFLGRLIDWACHNDSL